MYLDILPMFVDFDTYCFKIKLTHTHTHTHTHIYIYIYKKTFFSIRIKTITCIQRSVSNKMTEMLRYVPFEQRNVYTSGQQPPKGRNEG